MRLLRPLLALVPALLLLGPAPLRAADEVVIKLGTLAPEGSQWHLILKDMGEKWKQASGGKVVLRIYPGGVAGDEPDMVRKMRIGQLHAGALSIVGLSLISPESQALSIPQVITSYDELDYVRTRLAPKLEAKLREKGFVVLNWGDAGWVRFFSTRPAPAPKDMANLKVFVWTGDAATVDIWKDFGFKPVPLAATDIIPSLQTGLIEVVPMTAYTALGMQAFTIAKYVLDLKWAPLVGGTVVAAERWEQVPEELRPRLLALAAEAGKRLTDEIRKADAEAMTALAKRGVKVLPVSPEVEREWIELTEKAHPRARAEIVPAETFDEVKRLRDEFRASARARGAAGAASAP